MKQRTRRPQCFNPFNVWSPQNGVDLVLGGESEALKTRALVIKYNKRYVTGEKDRIYQSSSLFVLSTFSDYMSTHMSYSHSSLVYWVYLGRKNKKFVLPAYWTSLTQSMWLITWSFFINNFRDQQEGSVHKGAYSTSLVTWVLSLELT